MFNIFKKVNKNSIVSPASGRLIALENVKDDVFASGAMGKGFAVEIIDNKIVAPFDGKIGACFPTGHAVGISNNGVEIIVHIGIDTVELKGEGFNALVKVGDKVNKGQTLVEIDLDLIKSKGYDTTTMVVFPSGQDIEVKKLNQDVIANEEVGSIK